MPEQKDQQPKPPVSAPQGSGTKAPESKSWEKATPVDVIPGKEEQRKISK
jgi:hypothetical protein